MNNNTFSRWKESLHLKILSGYLILGLLVLGIITAVWYEKQVFEQAEAEERSLLMQRTAASEAYRGLITLRKMLPGLWDKSAQAAKRILKTWKTDGCVGLYVDNQTKEKAELWKTLCIVYNGSEKQQEVKLLKGTWEVLADGEDSFLWKHPQIAAEHMKVSPVSILILGKKEESR